MNKSKQSADIAQVKKALAILKRKGLYKAEKPRAKPTRYAMRQLKKYNDVVRGTSAVVKTDKKTARKLSAEFRTKNDRVVVPLMGSNVAPRITKEGAVQRRFSVGKTKYRIRPVRMVNGDFEPLGPNMSYTVPIREGRRTAMRTYGSLADLKAAIEAYEPGENSRGFDVAQYVQISEPDAPTKWKVSFRVLNEKRNRSRVIKAHDENEALAIFLAKFPEYKDAVILDIAPA